MPTSRDLYSRETIRIYFLHIGVEVTNGTGFYLLYIYIFVEQSYHINVQ